MRRRGFAPRSVRSVVFDVLNRYTASGEFVGRLLEEALARVDLGAADRRLATELTAGIVRRKLTLNALIEPLLKRPRHRVETELWTLLQLGAYQLVFLESVPAHAAVNETVELAREYGRRRWTGLLNGVLRSLSRDLSQSIVNEPAADAVPLTEGRYRRLRRPLFGDPASDPAAYLSQAFSYPRWLIERWLLHNDFSEVARLGFWFNSPAPPTLRVNTLRASRDAVLEALATKNIEAFPGRLPESIRLKSRIRIEELPGFENGHITIQDESAMFAVDLLDPRPGQTVLDLCAAPGTKTTHLAERMGNRGRILATDVSGERLALVEENCRRLGATIVEIRQISEDGTDLPLGPFDAVLVDVPCSNTGVLGKRPEARWRLHRRDIQELSVLQERLLTTALERAGPDGRVVYSTCSIEPRENQQVVGAVLSRQSGFRLAGELLHVPGRPADGGYQALIGRDGRPPS